MRVWIKSLRGRLVTYFLALSLVGVILVALIAYLQARDTLRKEIYERLNVAATLKTGELNQWVKERQQDVVLIGQLPEVREQVQALLSYRAPAPEYLSAYITLSDYFGALATNKPDLQEIFILNEENGQVIMSTDKTQEGQYRVTDQYFVQGKLDTFVQNVYPSPLTGKPAMTIATPLFDATGKRLGVLAAHLNLDRMDKIIGGEESQGLGQAGETYLVNQVNEFVSAERFGSQQFPRGVHSTGIDLAIQGKSGNGLYGNYQIPPIPVIGAYRWIEERELALLVEVPQSVAFAPANQLAVSTVGVGLLAAIALATGIYLLASRLTSPIDDLVEGAERVAMGQLGQPVPVRSDDELGTLAKSFNKMTDELHQLYSNLELQVNSRTSQLQASADVARAITSVLDAEQLMRQVVNLITDRFNFYYAAIFTLDESGKFAVLREATGEAGETLKQRGHRLEAGGQSMVGTAVGTRRARIALDVGKEAVRFANPLLPDTRSEIALPLVVGGRAIGALDVQSIQASAFDEASAAVLQSMADQVAVALENARLFQQAQANLEELELANRMLTQEGWQMFLQTRQANFAEFHQAGATPLTPEETYPLIMPASKPESQRVARIPLKIRGETIGTLVAELPAGESDKQIDAHWSEEDIEMLHAIATQAAQAMDNAKLFEDSRRRTAREQIISATTARMRESLDVETVLRIATDEIYRALGLEEITVKLSLEHENGKGTV